MHRYFSRTVARQTAQPKRMPRYFCLIVGQWKFENWHLYVEREHRAVRNQSIRWRMWDKVI